MDQMLECKKCSRKSPPNRSDCLYCGAPLENEGFKNEAPQKPSRTLDEWEKGFNVVVKPKNVTTDQEKFEKFAAEFGFDSEDIQKLFEADVAFPLARVESFEDAERLRDLLNSEIVDAAIIPDKELLLDIPQRRVRSIDFESDRISLKLFNTGDVVRFKSEDLRLMISGTIFERSFETVEKHSKKQANKTLHIDHSARDQQIIDIYAGEEKTGFRVIPAGFDFSTLGSEMSFLATENLQKLISKVGGLTENVVSVTVYDSIRNPLARVWKFEESTTSKGVTKKGVANINVARETTVTNLNQFNRFSRTCRQLI